MYTGITTDVNRRLEQHRCGNGSKYVRCRMPLELLLQKKIGSRNQALSIESRIKKLPKAKKEELLISASKLDDIMVKILSDGIE